MYQIEKDLQFVELVARRAEQSPTRFDSSLISYGIQTANLHEASRSGIITQKEERKLRNKFSRNENQKLGEILFPIYPPDE